MPIEPIFVDTSAFYALIDRSDRHHGAAKGLWPFLLDSRIALQTSSDVVTETMNLLQYRLGLSAACLWHDAVLQVIDVKWTDPETHGLGHELWMNLGRLGYNMVDCINFILMNRFQVKKVFCFKASYIDQGYCLVPGECSAKLCLEMDH